MAGSVFQCTTFRQGRHRVVYNDKLPRLFIEVATVKNHIHNLLEKLGVRSRGEAAAKVRRVRFAEGAMRSEVISTNAGYP